MVSKKSARQARTGEATAANNATARKLRSWFRGEITVRMGKFGCVLSSLLLAIACQAQTPVAVNVELSNQLGPYTPIYRWFGYDESN